MIERGLYSILPLNVVTTEHPETVIFENRVKDAMNVRIPGQSEHAIRSLLSDIQNQIIQNQINDGKSEAEMTSDVVYVTETEEYKVSVMGNANSFSIRLFNSRSYNAIENTGPHLLWDISKRDVNGKTGYVMETELYTRSADGTHDPGLRAYDYTMRMVQLLTEIRPDVMNNLSVYHTEIHKVDGDVYGPNSNYFKFIAQTMQDLQETTDLEVNMGGGHLLQQILHEVAKKIHPARMAQSVKMALGRGNNSFQIESITCANKPDVGKTENQKVGLESLLNTNTHPDYILINYSLRT